MVGQTMLSDHAEADWAASFEACKLDVVPDPVTMRIADLFIGGRSFASQPENKLGPDTVWNAIENNTDALLTFFHLLMTRERIPLIDYEYTFPSANFSRLGDIAIEVHPPIYYNVRERARAQLERVDLGRIPPERLSQLARERHDELTAVGYEWFPDPGEQFDTQTRTLGAILLGGLIFGHYARISGADHVLQPSRNSLLLELTQPDEAPLWGAQQEAKLFERLNAVVARDPRLSSSERELPPTILPHLIEQNLRDTRDLLDRALMLRETDDDFVHYRRWHAELRKAWSNGTHSESKENDVTDVTRELLKRYPPGQDPVEAPRLWSREIGLKATLGAEAGVEAGIKRELGPNEVNAGLKATAEVGLEADLGHVTVSFPNWIRNWLVEGLVFRNHRKVLLRMALAKKRSDHLVLGLRRLWERS